MATRHMQVRGHGEVARNCEAQGGVGARQRRHVLSSPRVIAVVASSLSVVGRWWALEGEGVSIGKKGDRRGDWAAKEEVSNKIKLRENVPVVY
jgi:hypothetical protein